MRLTMTTPPAALPVSLAEAKLQCRVEPEDIEDDSLIEGLIGAAVDYLDGPSGLLGRAIITQEWLLELERWPASIDLPLEPVQTVAVRYLDQEGAEQDLAPVEYDLISRPSARTRLCWADGVSLPPLQAVRFPVRISITAGFGDAAAVPEGLKTAIRMIIAHWYGHPEAVVPGGSDVGLPLLVGALLARWRLVL